MEEGGSEVGRIALPRKTPFSYPLGEGTIPDLEGKGAKPLQRKTSGKEFSSSASGECLSQIRMSSRARWKLRTGKTLGR